MERRLRVHNGLRRVLKEKGGLQRGKVGLVGGKVRP